jgi:ribosomal protein S18 acetylase RimI-like enzyme
MVGMLRDNGLVSPSNRGTFYGCRNEQGKLEGVALIGHATLIESQTERAIRAFAAVAQRCSATHMILGELECIQDFWTFYEEGGQEMRMARRESLFELRWPIEVQGESLGLRLATLAELELVTRPQAQMAFDESGINPLEKDPEGFRQRCKRRIEQGRTWVLVDQGTLLFQGDAISDTSEVIYLEGVWVNEQDRGNGYGVRCMSQLSKELLGRTKAISLLVDAKNKRAQAFYRKCGYRFISTYDTIFLRQRMEMAANVN